MIINYQLQYCEQDQLFCVVVVLEDEARLDQFPRPVVAQQYPRMMPSEEWHWPLARPRGHLAQETGGGGVPRPRTLIIATIATIAAIE